MFAMSICATTYINRQVFPQAPSPTITSFRRISAMLMCVGSDRGVKGGRGTVAGTGCQRKMGMEVVMKSGE
jgi:hypothetical protein